MVHRVFNVGYIKLKLCLAGTLFECLRTIWSYVATFLVSGYMSQSKFVNFPSIKAHKARKSHIHRLLSQPSKSTFCSHLNCSSNSGALALFNGFCLL